MCRFCKLEGLYCKSGTSWGVLRITTNLDKVSAICIERKTQREAVGESLQFPHFTDLNRILHPQISISAIIGDHRRSRERDRKFNDAAYSRRYTFLCCFMFMASSSKMESDGDDEAQEEEEV